MRTVGPRGKIVNALADAPRQRTQNAVPPHHRRNDFGPEAVLTVHDETWCLPALSDLTDSLLIVPCSKSKGEVVGRQTSGPRIGNRLPASLAERLDRARAVNRQRAGVGERTLAPAWQRYSGRFYHAAGGALAEAVRQRLHLLILSGGYGVLLAREPIGRYEAVLKTSWWPKRVLEGVLAGYAQRHRLKRMRAFVSRTTAYRLVVERTDWQVAGVNDAVLLMPGGGSQDSVSRTAGRGVRRAAQRYRARSELEQQGWTPLDLPEARLRRPSRRVRSSCTTPKHLQAGACNSAVVASKRLRQSEHPAWRERSRNSRIVLTGLRFQKRIRVLPGVRVNVGLRGVSTSVGVRGASLTVGKRGTYANDGAPGTGLSYRSRIDGPAGGRASSRTASARAGDMQVRLRPHDDGAVEVLDENGDTLPPRLVRVLRQQQGDTIDAWLQQQCDAINGELAAISEIDLIAWIRWQHSVSSISGDA